MTQDNNANDDLSAFNATRMDSIDLDDDPPTHDETMNALRTIYKTAVLRDSDVGGILTPNPHDGPQAIVLCCPADVARASDLVLDLCTRAHVAQIERERRN